MVTFKINEIEGRHIMTCNIPSVFLESNWLENKPTYFKFDSKMVKILCEINPSMEEYKTCTKSGIELMHEKMNKVLYDTLLGVTHFHEKLATKLLHWG